MAGITASCAYYLFLPAASKIDLYIGQLPSNSHSSIEHAQFKRLGYISLSDNEQTGYRVGELNHSIEQKIYKSVCGPYAWLVLKFSLFSDL